MFVRTELDTHVLAYSEGALVSCSLSADMTLAQVTAELVKVRTKQTTYSLILGGKPTSMIWDKWCRSKSRSSFQHTLV